VGNRIYTPEYKAKIVLEILKEEKHLSEIASRESINIRQLQNWRKEFLDNAYRAFATTRIEKEAKAMTKELELNEQELMAKVGQLTIENDWLKKKSVEMFGPDYEKRFSKKPI
jgi:transposase-like protein